MLMEVEEFMLVEVDRLSDGAHEDVHHSVVHIIVGIQIACVNQDSDPKRVVPQTNDEEIDKLAVSDLILGRQLELIIVVLLAIHFEDDVDILGCY